MIATLAMPSRSVLATLWDYLAEIVGRLGIGLESCTVDHDSPVSVYIALDGHLPDYPGRDVALIWDEIHGWAVAIETHSSEDLIVIRYLDGETVAPPATRVEQFVAALREGDSRIGALTPPEHRVASGLADLGLALERRIQKTRRC